MRIFPFYPQYDMMDCGSACLRMIAKWYGAEYSIQTLREMSYTNREGVSLNGIKVAAESMGFRAYGIRITIEDLIKEACLPCILHWNQNHFVVCYGIEKSKHGGFKIHISDPASQRLTYTKEEFERCWIGPQAHEDSNGVALLLEPGDDFGKIEDEYRKNSRSMLSFAGYFTPYRSMIGQLVLAMLVGSVIQMILPFLSQAMVDQGINGRNLNIITLILFAQLGFFVATLSIDYIRSWIMLHMNSRIDISSSALQRDTRSRSTNFSVSSTKNIPSIFTKLGADASYGFGDSEQAISSPMGGGQEGANIIKVRSNNYNLHGNASVTPIQWLELRYDIRYGWSRSRYSEESNTVTSLTHSGAIHIFPIATLDLSLDYDHVRRQITTDQYKRMSLFNASAQYKWKQCVLRLELTNLLNQRSYSYTVFDGINTYTYDYGLCGRTALMRLTFKL